MARGGTRPRRSAQGTSPVLQDSGWEIGDESPRPDSVILDIRSEGHYSEPDLDVAASTSSAGGVADSSSNDSPHELSCLDSAEALDQFKFTSPFTPPQRRRGRIKNGRPDIDPWDGPLPGKEKELTFEVELVKGQDGPQRLGVDVLHDVGTRGLLVRRINGGLVQAWNDTNPSQSVHVGDRIIEVDGNCGSGEVLIQHVRDAGSPLKLVLARLQEFEITLSKAGSLGIEVVQHPRSLVILSINAGPVAEWNTNNTVDVEVRLGDHIVEVNGKGGTALELLTRVRESEISVDFVVRRSHRSCIKKERARKSPMFFQQQDAAQFSSPECSNAQDAAQLSPPESDQLNWARAVTR
jgi:hypothetical protein